MAHGSGPALRAALVALLLVARPAAGQQPGAAPPAPPPAPAGAPAAADAATLRGMQELRQLLVAKGTIRPEDVDRLPPPELGKVAIEDLARYLFIRTHLAPAHYESIGAALETPGPAGTSRAFGELLRGLFERGVLSDADLEALLSPDGTRRITYVPELVRAQIREQLRREILDQMKRERWAAPDAYPDWLKRLKLRGDVRARYESDVFGPGNAVQDDFAAINANRPFDERGIDLANDRYLNVSEDRMRPRLRARIGLDAALGGGFAAGVRLATGDSSSPVSTNQTAGNGFAKGSLWLDRAFVRFEPYEGGRWIAADVGRFENPFLRTDLTWDDDLNLDGLALRGTLPIGGALRPFFVAGAFPVFATALNFPVESDVKFRSLDKWLYAGQLGVAWSPSDRLGVKLAGAFYDYEGIEGRVSSPCDIHLSYVTCDTDHTRPPFAQKGNTYRTLRIPSDQALLADPRGLGYQFFGLASEFQELVGTGRLEIGLGTTLRVTIDGEYARNLAFSRSETGPIALNNFGAQQCDEQGNCSDPYGGGDEAYLAQLTFGSPKQAERWDWLVGLGYRYIESDAVVDAFNDSDFGLGGTNLEGYTVAASLGLAKGVFAGARWLSADNIVGARYQVDVLMIDLQARF